MVFGNALDQIAIDSWRIDEMVLHKTAALVGNGFTVRAVGVPAQALAAYERPSFFTSPARPLIQAVSAAAAPTANCDVYLLVTPSTAELSGTNQSLTGLGILNRSPIYSMYYVYALFAVSAFDGKTLQALATKIPQSDSFLAGALVGPGIHGMYRKVDESLWPQPSQAAVQSAPLRSAIQGLVEQGLGEAIPGLSPFNGGS
jgi:hypothetical protein